MSYESVLEEVYDSTYKMLELAQKKQWSELLEADNYREDVLRKLDAQQINQEVEEVVSQKLKEILEINKLITVLSIQEKDNCLSEFNQVKNSKKATSEYTRY